MAAFARWTPHYSFVFVNDGSKDDTLAVLKSYASEHIRVLDLHKNVGKAEAVRQGMLHLLNHPSGQRFDWVGYWDADLYTPLDEIAQFLSYNDAMEYSADALWGSRIYRLGSHIQRSYFRHTMGRLFATVIGVVFKEITVYDSQCGAKLFQWNAIQSAFQEPFTSDWIFDLEIALRLSDRKIVEFPLKHWTAKSGSKLHIFANAPGICWDILRVRRRYPRRSS